jgi:tetratricopeptide (TPR) repeat protein
LPFSWGGEKIIKLPIQKPASHPPAKPSEKPEAAVPPVQTPFAVTVDFELEMKKVEALIRVNDKSAEAYFNRAWLYQYKGDMQKALQDYSKAIELDKGMKDALYNRGVLSAGMKKLEEALKDFSEVIRLDPSAADAYCNRGNIHYRMGKLDLALADYSSGLKADPHEADLFYNRAIVYLAKGDKSSATEDLKNSARLFHDRTRKEFPELASPPPPQLKKAALDGQVMEFLGYMSEELRQRVQGFEATRMKVEKAVLELEKKSKQLLGEKFRRQGNTMAFSIAGTDPRWAEVFGSRWPQMVEQNPNEPRFFYMSCEFGWKEEIQVLQRLQACLENPSYCQDAAVQNSAFHLKRMSGIWKLVDAKNPEEWKQVQAMGEGLARIIEWAHQFLSENKGKMGDEEMFISLAKGYMQKIMALSAKPNPTEKGSQ